MVIPVLIATIVLAMIAYGAWMAGELGVGPRWRRPRRDAGAEGDPATPE
jgi:hypothetical protein